MIKACFFDIGNVLIFVDFKQLLDNFSKLFSTNKFKLFLFLEKHDIRNRIEKGLLSEDEALVIFNRTFQTTTSFDAFKKAMCGCFEKNAAIEPIVNDLRQNHKLYLLSNTSPTHFEYLYSHFPILHCFDDKILSYEVQLMKPDERMYTHAIKLACVQPHEILYIDDIKPFCKAAKKQQICVHHFQSTHALEKDLTTLNLLPIKKT